MGKAYLGLILYIRDTRYTRLGAVLEGSAHILFGPLRLLLDKGVWPDP